MKMGFVRSRLRSLFVFLHSPFLPAFWELGQKSLG